MLAGEVVAPVLLEVAVADHGAEGEDGFGAVQAPSGPADVEAVGDEMPACSLDDAGRNRPAFREGLVVAQVLVPGTQVADAGVGSGSPARGSGRRRRPRRRSPPRPGRCRRPAPRAP